MVLLGGVKHLGGGSDGSGSLKCVLEGDVRPLGPPFFTCWPPAP